MIKKGNRAKVPTVEEAVTRKVAAEAGRATRDRKVTAGGALEVVNFK
jgi:hypothetical protein